ncbi:MAG: sigma-70 family RNA polymerase sigma factor [Woeseia sp.]
MNVTEDEQLVAGALAGNDAAFGMLVDRYQERLLRFLQTRSRCRADAEDALQDTLINAYRYLTSYNPRWRFSTWIYRIAIREAARNATVAATVPADDIAAADDPLATCIAAGERENLWLTAKRLLPPDMFTALWLHYAEDMPVSDIARSINRSMPWTKVALHRGRRRLRLAMAETETEQSKSEAYG